MSNVYTTYQLHRWVSIFNDFLQMSEICEIIKLSVEWVSKNWEVEVKEIFVGDDKKNQSWMNLRKDTLILKPAVEPWWRLWPYLWLMETPISNRTSFKDVLDMKKMLGLVGFCQEDEEADSSCHNG